MVACLASKGFKVIGVDVDPYKVDCINKGLAPVKEDALQSLISQNKDYICATQSIEDAVSKTNITFVIVATPSGSDGKFSLEYMLPACEEIGKAIQKKKSFHVVVVTSTVMPGDCDSKILDVLEKTSGLKSGEGFGLCYNPEFIALGSVVRDFLNPDFILLGTNDPLSECRVRQIYERVCPNAPIKSMSRLNAEITKLSLNSYITTKISFANMIARLCELIPGADVDVITDAIGTDSRVGKKYLKGGISYGGPCFPRDNRALAVLAEELGSYSEIPKIVDSFNRTLILWLADLVQETYFQRVFVSGLSYKNGTDLTEEAPGLLLLEELKRRIVPIAERPEDADVIVITMGEPPDIVWHGKTVIDCWRIAPYLKDKCKYIGLGQGCDR